MAELPMIESELGSSELFEQFDDSDSEEQYEQLDEIRDELYEQMVDWLEAKEHVPHVRPNRSKNIDFRIGDHEIWPDTFEDDHLNSITSSSLSMWVHSVSDIWAGRFIDDVVIHLPPTMEEFEDDIDAALDLDDRSFVIHYGTRALGGMPAPDGVITPHIHSTETVRYDQLESVIDQALDVFEDVYECGDRAIVKQPEEHRPD